jgi:hypothetical protein
MKLPQKFVIPGEAAKQLRPGIPFITDKPNGIPDQFSFVALQRRENFPE